MILVTPLLISILFVFVLVAIRFRAAVTNEPREK
jgi:hypothetical protein